MRHAIWSSPAGYSLPGEVVQVVGVCKCHGFNRIVSIEQLGEPEYHVSDSELSDLTHTPIEIAWKRAAQAEYAYGKGPESRAAVLQSLALMNGEKNK